MFLVAFLVTLFLLTLFVAAEKSSIRKQKRTSQLRSKLEDKLARDCAVTMACIQAFIQP